jgi:transcription antitermination factor NusG
MRIKVGSIIVRNTNGVIVIQGKEQVALEVPPDTMQLLLTMDLYNAKGKRIAHVRQNLWVVNEQDRFAIATSPSAPPLFPTPSWVMLNDKETGEVVLKVHAEDRDKVDLVRGIFFSHKGHLVEITPHYCRISGGFTRFAEVLDARGQAVLLGDDANSLGQSAAGTHA